MIPINFAGIPPFQWDQFTAYQVAEKPAIKTDSEEVQIEMLFANLSTRIPSQKQISYMNTVKIAYREQ